jgi:hypothetical protein
MPLCPVCDSYNAEGVENCGACSAPMSSPAILSPPGEGRSVSDARRPTGMSLIVAGWVAVAIGASLGLWGLIERRPATYAGDMEAVASSMQLRALAGQLLWVGFFLLLTGCIVRAIWFLPGADTKAPPDDRP